MMLRSSGVVSRLRLSEDDRISYVARLQRVVLTEPSMTNSVMNPVPDLSCSAI